MKAIAALLSPRWRSFSKGSFGARHGIKQTVLSAMGLAFWAGIFGVSLRVLTYFQQIEALGDILARKLLLMVLVTFMGLMVFSAVLTALSKLYLSRDLDLVHSLPAPARTVFAARWLESTVDSSWMVIVFTLPVLIAYGVVYRSGPLFYFDMLPALVPLAVTGSAVSVLVVLGAVVLLPANRVRSIFFFLGLGALVVVYVTFRVLRPERLVDPEAFQSVLAYLETMGAPAAPWLPSTWTFASLTAALRGDAAAAVFHLGICWSGALFLSLVAVLAADALYFKGFSKTQTAPGRRVRVRPPGHGFFARLLPGPVRALVVKELKTFWRDQTQWSQVFLMAALMVIYLYNYAVLPLEKAPIETLYLQNLFSFLNMALAAFVTTAIAARFAYPSVSTEGAAFWIVLGAPISLGTFLWVKFFIYLLPLLVLSEMLIVATNLLLHVTPFMMWLSTVTMLFLTPGVVALGVGLGGAYPDFASENPSQTVTSFGGLVFMMLSVAYIGAVVLLQAGPVYHYFMASVDGRRLPFIYQAWLGAAFLLASVLSALAVLLPMRFGTRRLGARYGIGAAKD